MKKFDNEIVEDFIDKGLSNLKLEQPSSNFNSLVLNKLNLSENKAFLLSTGWIRGIIVGLILAISYPIFVLFFGIEINTSSPYIVDYFNVFINYLILGYSYVTSQGAIIGYSITFTLSILMLIDQIVAYYNVSKNIYSTK